MTLQQDRILVLPDPKPEFNTTPGGILLTVDQNNDLPSGRVIEAGPGTHTEDGIFIENPIKKDDNVVFGRFSGEKYKEFLLMRAMDVIAVV